MIRWTEHHLAELESNFPEVNDTTCTNTLLQNTGKRQVVMFVKHKLKQQETRVDGASRNSSRGERPI